MIHLGRAFIELGKKCRLQWLKNLEHLLALLRGFRCRANLADIGCHWAEYHHIARLDLVARLREQELNEASVGQTITQCFNVNGRNNTLSPTI